MKMAKKSLFFYICLGYSISLHAWQQPAVSFDHNQRYSSYPYISSDTFRAIAHHHIDEAHGTFNPEQVADGHIIFVRGYPQFMSRFVRLLPRISKKFILITHSTDETMPGQYRYLLDDPRLIAWLTVNRDRTQNQKLIGVPIGLANPYWPHGNVRIMTDVIQEMRNAPKKHLLYVNVAIETNVQERDSVVHYFKEQPFAYAAPRKPWAEYLKDLARSKFVLSPPGHGMDCHRPWEALLMGSIPVMLSTSIDFLFNDLPVVIVKDWSEVTQEFLEKKYAEIQSKTYHLEKIYADYWLDKITIIRASLKKRRRQY